MEEKLETIKTRAYGEIQVPEGNRIEFKQPIFGFDDYRYYYLLEMKDLPNFYWLQCKEEPSLAFVVVNPRLFVEDYELSIDETDLKLLELDEGDEIIDLVIANIPEDPSLMTINLLGPILINAKKRYGIQGISNRDDYSTKYRVFQKEEQRETVKDLVE